MTWANQDAIRVTGKARIKRLMDLNEEINSQGVGMIGRG